MKTIRVNLQTKVNAAAVRNESVNGKEYIVLPSATLPDGVVMNGIEYPAEEIEKSYHTLEGTPAPLGHPMINGEYVSAVNVEAFEDYHVGAVNKNVTRSNGRVMLEKWVNVQYANRSDKGKRLLDAISYMRETGKPIHTSTGIFMNVEEVDGRKIARNMVFDHDAILLDEEGAATPNQGVGIGVNSKGEQIEVMTVNCEIDYPEIKPNQAESLFAKFKNWMSSQKFDTDENLTHNNHEFTNEGDAMRDLLINALANKGIKVNDDISDADLLAKYNNEFSDREQMAAVVNSVAKLTEQLNAVETKLAANEAKQAEAEKAQKAALGEALGLSAEEAQAMSVNTLQKMADKLNGSTNGLAGSYQANSQEQSIDYTMPSVEE